MNRIVKHILLDIIKNKIVFFYTLLLAALSWGVFGLEDNESKGVLSMLNIILLSVPLVSIIFSTIYIYNSSQFIELLLSQPIKRNRIWTALFLGLSLAFILAFLIGAGIPVLIFCQTELAITLIITGMLISMVFVSLAFFCAIISRDKARGIGLAIMTWLFFTIIFDALVLFLMIQFSDYPIEKAMIFITMLNPVDLARVLIILDLDISAMMGYSGAIFKNFLGSGSGISIAAIALICWAVIPFAISLFKFSKKDL